MVSYSSQKEAVCFLSSTTLSGEHDVCAILFSIAQDFVANMSMKVLPNPQWEQYWIGLSNMDSYPLFRWVRALPLTDMCTRIVDCLVVHTAQGD